MKRLSHLSLTALAGLLLGGCPETASVETDLPTAVVSSSGPGTPPVVVDPIIDPIDPGIYEPWWIDLRRPPGLPPQPSEPAPIDDRPSFTTSIPQASGGSPNAGPPSPGRTILIGHFDGHGQLSRWEDIFFDDNGELDQNRPPITAFQRCPITFKQDGTPTGVWVPMTNSGWVFAPASEMNTTVEVCYAEDFAGSENQVYLSATLIQREIDPFRVRWMAAIEFTAIDQNGDVTYAGTGTVVHVVGADLSGEANLSVYSEHTFPFDVLGTIARVEGVSQMECVIYASSTPGRAPSPARCTREDDFPEDDGNDDDNQNDDGAGDDGEDTGDDGDGSDEGAGDDGNDDGDQGDGGDDDDINPGDGGDDTGGGDDDGQPPILFGRQSGSVQCEILLEETGAADPNYVPNPADFIRIDGDISLDFGPGGTPDRVWMPGVFVLPDEYFNISQTGEEEFLEVCCEEPPGFVRSYHARVLDAAHADSLSRIVVQVDFQWIDGNGDVLVEASGTLTQWISVVGSNITYRGDAQYAITVFGALEVYMVETYDCDGTLD